MDNIIDEGVDVRFTLLLITILFVLPIHAKRAPAVVTANLQTHMTQQIHRVAREYKDMKNSLNMMNSGKGQTKLIRRQIFSKLGHQALPPIFQTGPYIRIFLNGFKKKPDLFYGQVEGNKVHFYYNGKDVTRQKGETMEKWMARLSHKTHKNEKKYKTSFFDFMLFPKAYAQSQYFDQNPILMSYNNEYSQKDNYNHQLWRERLMQYFATATDANSWENQAFDGSNNPFMGAEIDLMRKENLYRCDNQKHGYSTIFLNDSDGQSHEYTVESVYNYDKKKLEIQLHSSISGNFQSGEMPLGRMAITTNQEGQTAKVYYACDARTTCKGETPPSNISTSKDAGSNLSTILGVSLDQEEGAYAGAAIEALASFGAGCCGNAQCRDGRPMDQRPQILPRGQAPSSNQ